MTFSNLAPKWSPTVDLSFDHEDDDDDWQEMPVIRSNTSILDEEDQKRFHYSSPQVNQGTSKSSGVKSSSNATGHLMDLSEAAAARGEDWREKSNHLEESDYTRLGLDDDPDEDHLNMKTQYLFADEKGMTSHTQLKVTKNLLSEGQRIAYVGMCRLVMKEMLDGLKRGGHQEMDPAVESMKHWCAQILSRLFEHMDVEAREQQMIEQLAEHGVSAEDLVGSLITTHSIPNPNYDPSLPPEEDPVSASKSEDPRSAVNDTSDSSSDQSRTSFENAWVTKNEDSDPLGTMQVGSGDHQSPYKAHMTPSFGLEEGSMAPWASSSELSIGAKPSTAPSVHNSHSGTGRHEDLEDSDGNSEAQIKTPTTSGPSRSADPARIPTPDLASPDTSLPQTLPGVSTTLTAADKLIVLDIRWTVLCDLFLALIADSMYDARSRVLLGRCAHKLRLSWMDVVRFERRLTEALEVQEGISQETPNDVIDDHQRKSKTKRMVMMGAATIGGGLVIGLSAGLLAPVIGAGLAAGFTTIGIGGTSGFLAGAGGAAVITTAGTVTGMNIGGKGMSKRTRSVQTFQILPLHNNRRVNVFLTMPGFMEGANDDVRLPFSVMDQSMGDVLSVLWEPEMMGETGNIIKILTSEVLTQVGQQVLQATLLTALMSALQWPLMLTKLGYLIDNPWSNALDRARAAGAVLADVLVKRHIGVRPVSLIGFSLGARAIFYALVELAKKKAYGIVQEVYLLGATVTAPTKTWREVRGVVAGRFVNGYCTKDWILGYLYRATTGGLQTVAGLSPVDLVPDMENVDLTDIVVGHMSYRAQMPLILAELGFKVTADHFDEPDVMQEDDDEEEAPSRLKTVKEAEEKKRLILSFTKKLKNARRQSSTAATKDNKKDDDDDPPRLEHPITRSTSLSGRVPSGGMLNKECDPSLSTGVAHSTDSLQQEQEAQLAAKADTFDVTAIRQEIAKVASEGSNASEDVSAKDGWAQNLSKQIQPPPWGSSNDPWKS